VPVVLSIRRSPVWAAASSGEPMINVAQIRSAASASPGDIVGVSKAQLAELLTEIEIGQRARRALTNLRSLTAIAASASGAPS